MRKPPKSPQNTNVPLTLVHEDGPVAPIGIGETIGVPLEPEAPRAPEVPPQEAPQEPQGMPFQAREVPPPTEDTPESLAPFLTPADAPASGPTVQDAPPVGESKRKKGKETSPGVTDAERAQAAFMLGGMLEQLLGMGAKAVGSTLTPRELMERQHATARTRAASLGRPAPRPGTPLDVNPPALMRGDFQGFLVTEVSALLEWQEGQGFVPVRFALGPMVLSEDERARLTSDHEAPTQRNGALVLMQEPATIAHAIAAQLADGMESSMRNIAEFLQEYQTEIRLVYAGALLAFYGFQVWRDRAETGG